MLDKSRGEKPEKTPTVDVVVVNEEIIEPPGPLRSDPGTMDSSNPLSFITLSWLNRMMWLGVKRPLEYEDLPTLRESDRADRLDAVIAPWRTELKDALAKQTRGADAASDAKKIKVTSPLMCLIASNWPQYFLGMFLRISMTGISLFTPLVFGAIINVMNGVPDPNITFTRSGVGLALFLFALSVAKTLSDQVSSQLLRTFSINVNTVLTGAIFEKAMVLSNRSAKSFSEGRILQLVNSDVREIAFTLVYGYKAFLTPVEIAVTVWFLVRLVGASVYAAGISIGAALFLSMFLMAPLFNSMTRFKTAGDRRLKVFREMIISMKIIKLRGSEDQQVVPVVEARKKQLRALFGFSFALSMFAAILMLIPVVLPVSTFVLYAKSHDFLDPAIVFPALAYFASLFLPIQDLPQMIMSFMQGLISWNRIKTFLNCEERDLVKSNDDASSAVVFEDATFRWEEQQQDEKSSNDSKENNTDAKEAKPVNESKRAKKGKKEPPVQPSEPIFRDLSLKIPKGKLTAVVGPVGSGKSSLISATVGEMTKMSGEIYVNGSLAMCQQQPWLLSTTVKENILFNRPADEARLSDAINSCALDRDLREMENGIDTEIGEKGITLSGGQKARVALARAVYSDSDIYLLDDPLAALDAHVGKHVFDKCIVQALDGKTRLLITHHLHVLSHVDHVIVMKDGRVAEQGTFEEVLAMNGVLADLMKDHKVDSDNESVDTTVQVIDSVPKKTTEVAPPKASTAAGLIAEEDRQRGAVKFSVLAAYWKLSGGVLGVSAILFNLLLFICASTASTIWMAVWTQQGVPGYTTWDYLHVYISLSAAVAISLMFFFNSLVICGLIGSKNLHNGAVKGLLRAPMSWFDSQPVGRIVNRLTGDIESIDMNLPQTFLNFYINIGFVVCNLIATIYSAPWIIALFTVLSVLFYFFLILYRSAIREARRLSSTQKSPLMSHISESLSGVSTIRAFGSASQVVARQHRLMDNANVPALITMSISIWLDLRVQLFSTLVVLLIGLVGVTTTTISASLVGLALSQASEISSAISSFITFFALTEAELVNVERLKEYVSNLPVEAPVHLPTDPAPGEWPTKGEMVINDLVVKYASRDEPVIKGLSATFRGGEKIGIVGRTGSGKSTLLSALFRIVEPSGGSIVIDGQDISKLGLNTLRNRMQIIPQEPILFSGTIRSNIDAGDRFTDAEVWTALELVSLKDYVSELPLKLEAPVEEGGQNLSMGQRQLLILARAICHRPRILVLDEASSAVDVAADSLIQKAIQTEFGGSTVISIAHRLNTVADFDRILVLDAGMVAEFDTPANLLRREGGLFRSLVDATGPANAEHIREVAEAHEAGLVKNKDA